MQAMKSCLHYLLMIPDLNIAINILAQSMNNYAICKNIYNFSCFLFSFFSFFCFRRGGGDLQLSESKKANRMQGNIC